MTFLSANPRASWALPTPQGSLHNDGYVWRSPPSHHVTLSPHGHKVAAAVPATHRDQHNQNEWGHFPQQFFLEEKKVLPQVSLRPCS